MRPKEVIKLLEKAGWFEVRQSGSHKIFKHLKKELTIVVPYHNKEMGSGLTNKILKQAGLK